MIENQTVTGKDAPQRVDVERGFGRGWWNPRPFDTRSKFHYADHSGRSLCGRYGAIGVDVFEYGKDDHRDNCVACKRRIAALKDRAP